MLLSEHQDKLAQLENKFDSMERENSRLKEENQKHIAVSRNNKAGLEIALPLSAAADNSITLEKVVAGPVAPPRTPLPVDDSSEDEGTDEVGDMVSPTRVVHHARYVSQARNTYNAMRANRVANPKLEIIDSDEEEFQLAPESGDEEDESEAQQGVFRSGNTTINDATEGTSRSSAYNVPTFTIFPITKLNQYGRRFII